MQEEFYPAAEKIINDLYNLFKRDPKLKSFEIIPVVQIENKSPIYLEDHCLGLESWCVPHIYCYAYKNLMSLKQMKDKIRDIEKCDSLLIGALLLNPDITSFWNMRKELIKKGKLDPYFDLHFTSVVLTFKPKCADIFSFRKWILRQLLQDLRTDGNLIENGEIEICEAAADRYSNNYHAWTHRIWCLSQSSPSLLQKEWTASLKWVQRHVSDYSGFHYRQKLITFLLTYIQSRSYNPEVIKLIIFSVNEATESFLYNVKAYGLTTESIPLALKLFIYELSLDSDLILNFVGHEALWCHRRFIFHEIKCLLLDSNLSKNWGDFELSTFEDTPPEKSQKIGKHHIDDEFSLILSVYEDMFLNKCSNDREPRQIFYVDRHKQWLTKFSKFRLTINEGR